MARAMGETPDPSVGLHVVTGTGPIIEVTSATGSRALAVLLYRTAAHDTTAFAELYDATAPHVYGLAVRILGSPAVAQEVALESYIEAWRTSARFDAEEYSAIAWILTILLRRVLDRLDSATNPPSRPPIGALSHALRRVRTPSEETDHILEALTWLRPGQLASLDLACRKVEDPETVHLTTILSTLVDASVWEGMRRMDGTTYQGPASGAAPDPGRLQ